VRVIIAIAQVLFRRRQTDGLAVALQRALRAEGHVVELTRIPYAWGEREQVLGTMLSCRLLHLPSDALIALEFPAWLLPHPNKILWLTSGQWIPEGTARDVPGAAPPQQALREVCGHAAAALIPAAARVFTVSAATSHELRRYTELGVTPLYPPLPEADTFQWGQEGATPASPLRETASDAALDYLLVPVVGGCASRIGLLLEAMAQSREPVRVRIAGRAADQSRCQRAAARLGVSERVEWLDDVAEGRLAALYASSRGVVCAHRGDAFPWVALRAMVAAKPVIACADAGAVVEMVQHERTGLLTAPAPAELAAAMDALWSGAERAAGWGDTGRAAVEALSLRWSTVAQRLLG